MDIFGAIHKFFGLIRASILYLAMGYLFLGTIKFFSSLNSIGSEAHTRALVLNIEPSFIYFFAFEYLQFTL
jgi:hypothetical protein